MRPKFQIICTRNESFLDGVSPADDVALFVRAKRRLNGEPEKVTMSVKHLNPLCSCCVSVMSYPDSTK
jgi:hypothetical protein